MRMLYSLILVYSNYLLTNGYNTPQEISTMNFSKIQDRFFEVKMNEEIAEEMLPYDFDEY
mgnify:CR=1 FL=1